MQPFTKVDLSQIPFHEIIRNFMILEVGNVPENPLLYLYPNIPRDDAFGKYYSEKTGGKGGTKIISSVGGTDVIEVVFCDEQRYSILIIWQHMH